MRPSGCGSLTSSVRHVIGRREGIMRRALAAAAAWGALLLGSSALGATPAAAPATSAAPATAAHALTAQDAETWLDGYMPYALERGGVPGAVVVVVKDGQV